MIAGFKDNHLILKFETQDELRTFYAVFNNAQVCNQIFARTGRRLPSMDDTIREAIVTSESPEYVEFACDAIRI